MTDIKRMEKPTDLICDKCGKPMVIKWGKHGSFIACTGYPECTNTRELTVDLPDMDKGGDLASKTRRILRELRPSHGPEEGPLRTFFACSGYPDCKTTKQIGGEQSKDVPLEEKCPQCESNLVQKFGRFGEFVACSNYPEVQVCQAEDHRRDCPNCTEGEVVERRSKRGKTFFGCNRYPECDFVAWGKPIHGEMPRLRQPLYDREVPEGWPGAQCPNKECKFKRALETEPEREKVTA